jgi:hypothetical protein
MIPAPLGLARFLLLADSVPVFGYLWLFLRMYYFFSTGAQILSTFVLCSITMLRQCKSLSSGNLCDCRSADYTVLNFSVSSAFSI